MRMGDQLNWVYISISLLGVLFVLMLGLNPPYSGGDFSLRKPVIGLSFALICVLGALAALFPKKCSTIPHYSSISAKTSQYFQGLSKGHHPVCKQFASHTIVLCGKVLCAGCTGLFIGALLSIVCAGSYFLLGLEGIHAQMSIFLGSFGLVLGFAQFAFRGFVRSLMNVFFVVGALMILIGVDSLVQNFFIDLFVLALTLFWILTRILLSQQDHNQVCRICISMKKECELFLKYNKSNSNR
ncbi:MAG: hypothetical protein N3D12_06550 [Candidatus Methanomethyliaceae archaeon]|nr:hypothetical protein [Candidatus Methanomethyliaceae archaeon]